MSCDKRWHGAVDRMSYPNPGRLGFESQFYHEGFLGDLGPVTFSHTNLSHKIVPTREQNVGTT